jgi:hypothetical protein
MNENGSFSGDYNLFAFSLVHIKSSPLRIYTLMTSAVLHSLVLIYQLFKLHLNLAFARTLATDRFIKYSAVCTVQFVICRPALLVRLHHPRFPNTAQYIFTERLTARTPLRNKTIEVDLPILVAKHVSKIFMMADCVLQ